MTNNLLKQNLPIDYVIPFVDCSDDKWLCEYKKLLVSAKNLW